MLMQVFIVGFAGYAASRAIMRFRAGELDAARLGFWLAIWVGAAATALVPQVTDGVAAMLGVGRGVDAVLYLAVIALFYLLFRTYVKLERIEHELTLIVRRIGLAQLDADEREQPKR